VDEKRGRERLKMICLDTIENDMRSFSVCVRDLENPDKWKFKTKVANPK